MRPSTAGRCGTGTGRALAIVAVRPVPRAAGLASFPDRWATQAATERLGKGSLEKLLHSGDTWNVG